MRKSTIFGLAAGLAMFAGATAQAADAYNLLPAPGKASDLQYVSVIFPEKNVEVYENSRMPMATLYNASTNEYYYCQVADQNTFAEVDGMQFDFTFVSEETEVSDPIVTPGTYELAIRGFYYVDADGNNTGDVPVITAEYTIEYPVAYNLTPAAGVATNLKEITLEFPDNKNVQFYENNPMPVASLVNNTTGTVYYCEEAMANTFAPSDGKVFTLTFLEEDAEEAADINFPGDYTLTIRAFGLATETETEEGLEVEIADLPVITANYTIAYPYEYTLNPEAGEVNVISDITISFPGTTNIGYDYATVILSNLATQEEYFGAVTNHNASFEGSQFTFSFYEDEAAYENEQEPVEVSAPGIYVLSVRGLSRILIDDATGEEMDPEFLPPFTADYIINYPVAYSLSPMPGNVPFINEITIEFPEAKVGYDYARIVLADETDENVYVGEVVAHNTRVEGGTEFTIAFYEDETASANGESPVIISNLGAYTLTIAGLYQSIYNETTEDFDDEFLPSVVVNYNIVYPINYILTPANGAVVSELSEVVLNFNYEYAGFYENNQMPVAIIEHIDEDGEVDAIYEGDATRNTKAETEGAEYTIKFKAEGEEDVVTLTEEGTYVLTIRALCYYPETKVGEDGEVNEGDAVSLPVIVSTFTIDSSYSKVELNPGQIENNVYNVYTLSGVQVMKNAKNLNGLSDGIYIVNGKKVVIRK